MIESQLLELLTKIFGLKRNTYNSPSDSYEQDTLFVSIAECTSRVSGNYLTAKARGSITVYAKGEKLPFGFFNKKIEMADNSLTKNLFFYNIDTDIENSPARVQDIHERRCEFVFLYKEQFDPEKGLLTSLELTEI